MLFGRFRGPQNEKLENKNVYRWPLSFNKNNAMLFGKFRGPKFEKLEIKQNVLIVGYFLTKLMT